MILAEMTGTDVAAIIAAVAAVVAVCVLIVGVVSLTRTLTAVRMSIEQLRRESLPVIEDAHLTVLQANSQLGRVENLLSEDYYEVFAFPTDGRAAYVGARVKF